MAPMASVACGVRPLVVRGVHQRPEAFWVASRRVNGDADGTRELIDAKRQRENTAVATGEMPAHL